jgi:hypothetical protein
VSKRKRKRSRSQKEQVGKRERAVQQHFLQSFRQSFRRAHSATVTLYLDEDLKVKALPNAPPVLVSLCRHMKFVERDGRMPPHALSLLERLLTDIRMEPVWQSLGHAIRGSSVNKQDVIYRGIWGAIHYSWARCKYPIASRRELKKAIFRIGQGLQQVGKAIAPYFPKKSLPTKKEKKVWPGVPSWLVWECLPDEIAAVLDHWAPHMGHVAMKANETARTVLETKRSIDRSGYDWSVFIRLLQQQCPESLKATLTHQTLAQIACAVFPDTPVTSQEVRDTLRRTSPPQSH